MRVLQGVEPGRFGLDLIAYCVRALFRGVAAMFLVYEDTRLTEAQLTSMLGSPAMRDQAGQSSCVSP